MGLFYVLTGKGLRTFASKSIPSPSHCGVLRRTIPNRLRSSRSGPAPPWGDFLHLQPKNQGLRHETVVPYSNTID